MPDLIRTLAIDPGTKFLGMAVFEGLTPKFIGSIRAEDRLRVHERITKILWEMSQRMGRYRIDQVVCERPPSNPKRPVHSLQVLYTEIGHWARTNARFPKPFHQVRVGEVRTLCQPRGMKWGKPAAKIGAMALYPDLNIDELNEDEIDALLVGHAFLHRATTEYPT